MRLVALDLVRFFAALSVVLYHYTARHGSNNFPILSEITKFGYLGVPLFFMISGYVITLSAHNRNSLEFAVSRFVRLYPTYWAGILFTTLVTVLYGERTFNPLQVLANFTMLNDYVGFKNVDGVYWTLQAELKFYACVFILILLGKFNNIRIWLSGWLFLTALHLATKQPFFMGWFITPYYSSFFIAGVAFYLIHTEGLNKYNIFVLISSLIISSFRAFNETSGFIVHPTLTAQYIAVTAIWIFYFVFYLLVKEKIKLTKRNLYLTLGGLTYPLYLIHNAAGTSIIDNTKRYLSEDIAVVITILIVLFVSYLMHIGIEKKLATPMKLKLHALIRSLK